MRSNQKQPNTQIKPQTNTTTTKTATTTTKVPTK